MADKGISQLVESHHAELRRRQESLVKGWSKHISAINEHMKAKHGREMTELETCNVAQCLENALENAGRGKHTKLFEATTEDSIEFLGMRELCAA